MVRAAPARPPARACATTAPHPRLAPSTPPRHPLRQQDAWWSQPPSSGWASSTLVRVPHGLRRVPRLPESIRLTARLAVNANCGGPGFDLGMRPDGRRNYRAGVPCAATAASCPRSPPAASQGWHPCMRTARTWEPAGRSPMRARLGAQRAVAVSERETRDRTVATNHAPPAKRSVGGCVSRPLAYSGGPPYRPMTQPGSSGSVSASCRTRWWSTLPIHGLRRSLRSSRTRRRTRWWSTLPIHDATQEPLSAAADWLLWRGVAAGSAGHAPCRDRRPTSLRSNRPSPGPHWGPIRRVVDRRRRSDREPANAECGMGNKGERAGFGCDERPGWVPSAFGWRWALPRRWTLRAGCQARPRRGDMHGWERPSVEQPRNGRSAPPTRGAAGHAWRQHPCAEDELRMIEPRVTGALVSHRLQRLAPIIEARAGQVPVLLGGCCMRVLGGCHLGCQPATSGRAPWQGWDSASWPCGGALQRIHPLAGSGPGPR